MPAPASVPAKTAGTASVETAKTSAAVEPSNPAMESAHPTMETTHATPESAESASESAKPMIKPAITSPPPASANDYRPTVESPIAIVRVTVIILAPLLRLGCSWSLRIDGQLWFCVRKLRKPSDFMPFWPQKCPDQWAKDWAIGHDFRQKPDFSGDFQRPNLMMWDIMGKKFFHRR